MISNLNNLSNTNLSGSGLTTRDTAAQGTQSTGAVGQQGRTAGSAYVQVTGLPARPPELAEGEQVTARIVDQLDPQRVVALIKNSLFTLTLPQDTQLSGNDLKLTVASLRPDLTFTLSQAAQDGQVPAEGSAQVVLSPSAQYLTNLLSAALGDSQTADAAVTLGGAAASAQELAQSAPLTDSPAEPAKLAQGLAQAVNKSGVFYESHVKSWAQGRLPLESLRQEPQARLMDEVRNKSSAQALDSLTQNDAGVSSNRVLSSQAAPQLGQLVQRQLDTLENRAVFLQVMAWPNQQVTMQIQEEQVSERDAQERADERAWTSRLSLDLPGLGNVNVNVRLVNGAVQVDFRAQDEGTGQLIREHVARLSSGMDAAGLNLSQMTVQHG